MLFRLGGNRLPYQMLYFLNSRPLTQRAPQVDFVI
jgi:hypothetical protein